MPARRKTPGRPCAQCGKPVMVCGSERKYCDKRCARAALQPYSDEYWAAYKRRYRAQLRERFGNLPARRLHALVAATASQRERGEIPCGCFDGDAEEGAG